MKIITALTLSIIASVSYAQDNLRSAVIYDFKAKETVGVIGYKVASLPDLLGTKASGEVWAIGSYGTNTGTGSLGTAMVLPFRLAKNATAYVGGAWTTALQHKPSLGVIFGLKFAL